MLVNLIFNALDAMPDGGELTLRVHRDANRPGFVDLEVKDTGVGMTPEVRKRCLEPFFTTKGASGTGLGLATSYGIVKRHHGEIQIESEPGQGTRMIVALPMVAPNNVLEVRREGSRTPAKRILVIDDEEVVRTVIAEYLLFDGHTVDLADGPGVGLSKLKAGEYDLIITDRSMPEMSGDQLALMAKRVAEKGEWVDDPLQPVGIPIIVIDVTRCCEAATGAGRHQDAGFQTGVARRLNLQPDMRRHLPRAQNGIRRQHDVERALEPNQTCVLAHNACAERVADHLAGVLQPNISYQSVDERQVAGEGVATRLAEDDKSCSGRRSFPAPVQICGRRRERRFEPRQHRPVTLQRADFGQRLAHIVVAHDVAEVVQRHLRQLVDQRFVRLSLAAAIVQRKDLSPYGTFGCGIKRKSGRRGKNGEYNNENAACRLHAGPHHDGRNDPPPRILLSPRSDRLGRHAILALKKPHHLRSQCFAQVLAAT